MSWNAMAAARRSLLASIVGLLAAAPLLAAGPDADTLFPIETVGFISLQNVPDFHTRWERTQMGKLANDPAMRPFVDSLRDQFNNRVGRLDEKIGVTIDELADVATGEAAIGLVGLTEERDQAAVAVVIDVTNNDAEAQEILEKIDTVLTARGATATGEVDKGDVKIYTIPAGEDEAGEPIPERITACFLTANRLGASEDPNVAKEIVSKLRGGQGKTLRDRESYQSTIDRSRKAARGMAANVQWYLSPFEYDLAAKTTEESKPAEGEPEKEDTLAMLRDQGFDAIKGIGGQVMVAADPRRDFIHHTIIYAPPKPGTEGKPAAEKYDLAMRMFELANSKEAPTAASWAPREVASYKTVNIDIQNAFDHVASLFDAIAGYENAFETTLEGFEKDPYGPKINLRDEIVEHLGGRVTMMTDYTLPITEDCERFLIVIDVKNEESLREPLDKLLESDGAEPKEIEGVPYWEIVPEDEALGDSDLDAGLLPMDGFESYDEPEEEEGVLRRAAVCLYKGKLAIGSDAEFLGLALFGLGERDSLDRCADLQAALVTLKQISPGPRCAWNFTRTDESIRPTYELLRAGKMPEAETFFGRLLNRMLRTDDEAEVGADREQKIDGSKLPSFELARRYFGPTVRAVHSVDDGWVISGVLMSKATE